MDFVELLPLSLIFTAVGGGFYFIQRFFCQYFIRLCLRLLPVYIIALVLLFDLAILAGLNYSVFGAELTSYPRPEELFASLTLVLFLPPAAIGSGAAWIVWALGRKKEK